MAYVKAVGSQHAAGGGGPPGPGARRRPGRDAAQASPPRPGSHWAPSRTCSARRRQLLKAVIQDVTEEIAEAAPGLGGDRHADSSSAIRAGIDTFWTRLVVDERWLQVMQYELVMYALRTPGLEHLARWQTERYCRIVAAWCQEAANNAGELCAVPFEALARVLVGQRRRDDPAVRGRPGRRPGRGATWPWSPRCWSTWWTSGPLADSAPQSRTSRSAKNRTIVQDFP